MWTLVFDQVLMMGWAWAGREAWDTATTTVVNIIHKYNRTIKTCGELILASNELASKFKHNTPHFNKSVPILSFVPKGLHKTGANITQSTNTSKERTSSTGHMRNRSNWPNCIAPFHSPATVRSGGDARVRG